MAGTPHTITRRAVGVSQLIVFRECRPEVCMIRAALFDFDGTLADSFAAITASTNHVRQHFGLATLTEEAVRGHVGHGLPHLLSVLIPKAPVEDAVSLYRAHHETVMFDLTRPMPGVTQTIPELVRRGYRLGVCSNKRVEFTRRLVEALGFGRHINGGGRRARRGPGSDAERLRGAVGSVAGGVKTVLWIAVLLWDLWVL
jgi:hypothetical protein